MSNKIDGLRKMNKEEVSKHRKVILDLIGEENKPAKKIEKSTGKMLDGLVVVNNTTKKINTGLLKQDKEKWEREGRELGIKDEVKNTTQRKEILNDDDMSEVEDKTSNFVSKPEIQVKRKVSSPKIEQKRVMPKTEDKKAKKKKPVIKKKEQGEKTKKTIKRKIKNKKIKKTPAKIIIDKKKIKEEREAAALLKKKELEKIELIKRLKKERKERKRKELKEKFKKSVTSFKMFFVNNFKKALLYVLVIFLSIIALYLLYYVLITRVSSRLFDKVSNYIYTPVIISSDGVIDYKDYIKIKNQDGDLTFNIVKEYALSRLIKKYNLKNEGEIDDKIIYGSEVNKVPISRLAKIKELVENGDDFITISSKYGDKAGQIIITSSYKYYKFVKDLKIDGVSDIIQEDNGFYLFKKISDTQYRYVYLDAITLDGYFVEYSKGFEFLNFVK